VRRRVTGAEAGRPLAEVLAAAVAPVIGREVPRSRLRAMIVAGAVRVDGRVVRSGARPLRAGQTVEAFARVDALRPPAEATDRPFELTPAAVLYRDEWLVAVAKPAGLPTHATADRSRPSLVAHVERFLAESGGPGAVAVHQRLDRDTSGVVLFASSPAANAGLARAFDGHEVEKVYLALTARPNRLPPAAFVVDAPLAAGGPARRPVRAGGEGARPARTEVAVRETLPGALLVEARPLTGRRHQVRVHLSHAGLPILGDPFYGDASAAPRLMLHAARLVLRHPVTGEALSIECPLPPDFGGLVSRLRATKR
jgi:23S rRNA pseudouridine1911/1915/1917 synthase